jgi:hypothetical protein
VGLSSVELVIAPPCWSGSLLSIVLVDETCMKMQLDAATCVLFNFLPSKLPT